MVRADDEHKSANEAEKNTSTRGSFFEKLKFWKRDKKDADEPAQLTPMPPLPNEVVGSVWTRRTIACHLHSDCILVGRSLPLALIRCDDALRNNRGDRLRILSLAAAEP